jgi:uncharacterized Ntn-hydrolase superfamily protein
MRKNLFVLALALALSAVCARAEAPKGGTFSIVACDPVNQDWGVAVASKFFAVGSVVPWAKAGVGAVATQAFANTSFGPRGLLILEQGADAGGALKVLVDSDTGRAQRQVGIVDAKGGAATYTGEKCNTWAGGVAGVNYACQGNILVGEKVVQAMARTFETSKGELAERLLAALEAGDAAGGDSRGRQSAAILVVRPGGGYGGWDDRYLDIRVDDDPQPIKGLRRMMETGLTMAALNRASALRVQGKLDQAVAAMEKAVERYPKSGDCWYDYACYLSLSGSKVEALAALKKALVLTPKSVSMAKTDTDLDPLRKDPEFKRLVK